MGTQRRTQILRSKNAERRTQGRTQNATLRNAVGTQIRKSEGHECGARPRRPVLSAATACTLGRDGLCSGTQCVLERGGCVLERGARTQRTQTRGLCSRTRVLKTPKHGVPRNRFGLRFGFRFGFRFISGPRFGIGFIFGFGFGCAFRPTCTGRRGRDVQAVTVEMYRPSWLGGRWAPQTWPTTSERLN